MHSIQAHKPYLGAILEKDARVIDFAPGQVTLSLPKGGLRSPQEISTSLKQELQHLTGQNWLVHLVSGEANAPTIKEEKTRAAQEKLAKIAQEEDIKAILQAFPGARITQVKES